jgi:hypothetical protein
MAVIICVLPGSVEEKQLQAIPIARPLTVSFRKPSFGHNRVTSQQSDRPSDCWSQTRVSQYLSLREGQVLRHGPTAHRERVPENMEADANAVDTMQPMAGRGGMLEDDDLMTFRCPIIGLRE